MYTEVSLFSNSVILPAIMYNPLNGDKSLNKGSGFYYGFAVADNPASLDIQSNIPQYQPPSNTANLLSFFNQPAATSHMYWLSITDKDKMMYFEVVPSREMLEKQNVPTLYRESNSATELAKRANDRAKPLGRVLSIWHFILTYQNLMRASIAFPSSYFLIINLMRSRCRILKPLISGTSSTNGCKRLLLLQQVQ